MFTKSSVSVNQDNQADFLGPDLERRILQGLSCEWEKALWVLPSRSGRKMLPPFSGLRDFQDRWGSWSREKREIALSR